MKLIFLMLALVSSRALASGEDLVNCRWQNGTPIDPHSVCEKLKKYAVEDDAKAKQQQEAIQQFEKQRQEEEAKRAAEQVAREQQDKLDRDKWQKEKAERDAERERQDQADAKAEAALKRKCGKDYLMPHIGMTFERAVQCVGDFTLVSQLNRKDGIVSTYASGDIYINVMNGRIMAWYSN